MVTEFEEHTPHLTDDELRICEIFIKFIRSKGRSQAMRSNLIVEQINEILINRGMSQRLYAARLRKITNYIRVNALLPLRATPVGYYVSDDPKEIRAQIQSLRDRSAGILAAAKGLEHFLNKPTKIGQQSLFETEQDNDNRI